MNNDLISREALINSKPNFMNEKVVRNTKYRTMRDRFYAKAWNACNSYWINTIKYAPTVLVNDSQGLVNDLVKERPTGEWKRDDEHSITFDIFKCSHCGGWGATHFWFCPKCGANMKQGGN